MQAFDENVAALAIEGAHLGHAILRAGESRGGGDLDGGEGAVIEIGFHAGQCGDEARVAGGEAHAPARHGIGFGHRGEFDRDVFGTRHLQHGGRRVAVKIDLRVGEVRDDENAGFFGECHQLLIEIQVRHVGGGVGREVDDQGGRLGDGVAHRAVDGGQHRLAGLGGDGADGGAGDDEAELVDGVGGVGDDDGVAGRGDGGGEVGQALFRAEGRDDFSLRVQLHVEPALIIGGERAAQAGDAFGGGIAVAAGVLHGFHELRDDMGRRGAVRVAHAEIDDVFRGGAGLRLGGVDLREDVRGQAADAVEFFGHETLGLGYGAPNIPIARSRQNRRWRR